VQGPHIYTVQIVLITLAHAALSVRSGGPAPRLGCSKVARVRLQMLTKREPGHSGSTPG
jgi:hypothetical protein